MKKNYLMVGTSVSSTDLFEIITSGKTAVIKA